ncbi:uncharacterized protein LOC117787464 isoform X2 [Drosophila innubila]|uniref:uncharacterized protein LOC117787464 isoform X2 n=1 Tax=Drosophila innubila TaxID=198719 RepID=UPI00148C9CD1|nr:uncharacterized protein LOC117787464 isoform X2 [Drosophila innubila]
MPPDQAEVLQQKIANLIGDNETKKVKKSLIRQRQQVFDNVWRQRKYTNDVLLSAIIYVLVTDETDPELAIRSNSFSCHPVIRTRKCVIDNASDSDSYNDNSNGCCMIFIDEQGRVYANWRQYVYNNTLPRGTMIAPSQGIYRLTNGEDNGVHLMVHATPASRVKYKILKASDKVATVGGLVAGVPVAAALAVPVAPPLLLGATLVGVTAAAYSTVRSASWLYERRQYGQSTSLRDSEARNSWLGVAGGVVGLGATGAAKALSVAGTEVNAAAQLAVKGINVSSIVISGTGVANSAYDLYLKISDDQPLSSLDLLQIAASLIIFTHSINNLRLAHQATDGASLRYAVRNQTSKVFGQIAEESAKLHSDSAVKKFDIVRTLNDIPYKEALLSALAANLTEVGTSLLPNLISLSDDGQMRLNVELLAKQFGSKFVQHISNWSNLMDVLLALAEYFTEQTVQLLMQLTRSFLEQNVDGIECALNTFLSTETILYRILMECVRNYKDFTVEFLEQRREEILAIVSTYFQALEPNNTKSSRKFKCKDCHGYYYLKN